MVRAFFNDSRTSLCGTRKRNRAGSVRKRERHTEGVEMAGHHESHQAGPQKGKRANRIDAGAKTKRGLC